MKTWKNAEVVELNINETAWGIACSDKERGFIIGTHDCEDGSYGEDDKKADTMNPGPPEASCSVSCR